MLLGIGYDAFVVVPAMLQDPAELTNCSYKKQHCHLIASFLFSLYLQGGNWVSYSLQQSGHRKAQTPRARSLIQKPSAKFLSQEQHVAFGFFTLAPSLGFTQADRVNCGRNCSANQGCRMRNINLSQSGKIEDKAVVCVPLPHSLGNVQV